MNAENSTGNPAGLPLHERARQGLLLAEPELLLSEVLELEFPTATSWEDKQSPKYLNWQKIIDAAIRFGILVTRKESIKYRNAIFRTNPRHYRGWLDGLPPPQLTTEIYGTETRYWITQENYRAWRAIQKNLPADSIVDLWLGATPTAETIPPAIHSLPEPVAPESVAQGGAAEKKAALMALLAEIDKRAAKQGAGFNRHCLPGTKAEFYELLKAYCPAFGYIDLGSTDDNYFHGNCQFHRGHKPEKRKGAAIWALFPEYPNLKLG